MGDKTNPETPVTPEPKQEEKSKDECEIKAVYGYHIALCGLFIAFAIAAIMIFAGMRTASDLVSVIAVFTGITGTLVAYFFGEKSGAAGKKNVEKQLSTTVDELISEKGSNAQNTGKLDMYRKKVNVLLKYLEDDQNKIDEVCKLVEKVKQNKFTYSMARTDFITKGVRADMPGEKEDIGSLDEALLLLKEAKIPKEILDQYIGE